MRYFKTFLRVLFAVAAIFSSNLFAETSVKDLPLIPAPSEIRVLESESALAVANVNAIYADSRSANAAKYLQHLFKARYKRALEIRRSSTPNVIVGGINLVSGTGKKNPEAYQMTINASGVLVQGVGSAGTFYGVCTLDQLFIGENGCNAQKIPALKIKDEPRFSYRGLMLDPARNFMPLRDVKKFVETMARYKFNTLHFHISEDQGWRVEIKNPKYKKLMSIGAQKNKPKGTRGYYTQEEIRELVAFAGKLNIEVVPEIDMPGHSMGAIVAYPELTCEYVRRINKPGNSAELAKNPKMKLRIWEEAGVSEALLCAGSAKTYDFYDDLLEELCKLFPSPKFHIGGDEAPTKCWQNCKDCQAFMKKKGLKSVQELMAYFFQRNFDALGKAGKTALYWYELDVPKYPKNAIMYAWRMGRTKETIDRALREGYKVICCPGEYAYLDYPQKPGDPNHGWMPLTTLERSYQFDPGYGRPPDEEASILGCEGTLWAEHIPSLDRLYYQAFPRALAIVEAGWTPMSRRDWASFKKRLRPILSDMHKRGISTFWPKDDIGAK